MDNIEEFRAWMEKHDWYRLFQVTFGDGRTLEHWLSPRGDFFIVQYWKDGRFEVHPYRER